MRRREKVGIGDDVIDMGPEEFLVGVVEVGSDARQGPWSTSRGSVAFDIPRARESN